MKKEENGMKVIKEVPEDMGFLDPTIKLGPVVLAPLVKPPTLPNDDIGLEISSRRIDSVEKNFILDMGGES